MQAFEKVFDSNQFIGGLRLKRRGKKEGRKNPGRNQLILSFTR